jgi:hypothetical protein
MTPSMPCGTDKAQYKNLIGHTPDRPHQSNIHATHHFLRRYHAADSSLHRLSKHR